MMKAQEGFAKLKSFDTEFFLQKLTVSLGRTPSAITAKTKTGKPLPQSVDVALGDFKNISRKHATIRYNFKDKHFELICHGKNGVKINGVFYSADDKRSLKLQHGSEVQIGDAFFVFLHPTPSNKAAQKRKSFANSANFTVKPSKKVTDAKKKVSKKGKDPQAPATPSSDAQGMRPASPVSSAPSSPTGDQDEPKKKKKTRPAVVFDEETNQMYEKPTQSYATMIAQALSAQQNKQLTLQGIYQWIMDNYPYYQNADVGWRSSVRHNLSLNKFFRKVPAGETEHGKRAVYALNEEFEDYLLSGLTGRKLTKHIREKEAQDKVTDTPSTPDQDGSDASSSKKGKKPKEAKQKKESTKRKKEASGGQQPAKRQRTSTPMDSSPGVQAHVQQPSMQAQPDFSFLQQSMLQATQQLPTAQQPPLQSQIAAAQHAQQSSQMASAAPMLQHPYSAAFASANMQHLKTMLEQQRQFQAQNAKQFSTLGFPMAALAQNFPAATPQGNPANPAITNPLFFLSQFQQPQQAQQMQQQQQHQQPNNNPTSNNP